jgi:PIN domain nuclease of toxin-antitoxin system
VTILLDTHTVLWFWWDDPRLSATARALLCDATSRKLVSLATAWEVAIKVSQKKLEIGGSFSGFFPQHMLRSYFEWLHVSDDHLAAVACLPFHHKDPFDRMLIAQARVENIPIVSGDEAFDPYGIKRLW